MLGLKVVNLVVILLERHYMWAITNQPWSMMHDNSFKYDGY